MKKLLTTIFVALFANVLFAQTIKSGEYEFGLNLAFNNKTKRLTGYFENYTGWNQKTKAPMFSCIFYIEGIVNRNKFDVLTYYPGDKTDNTISGIIKILNDSTVEIKLEKEHGGCWNVQHFSGEPVKFKNENEKEWKEMKYVTANKTYFYAKKSLDAKQKAYVIKNDIVYVNKTAGDWTYCTFLGERITKGWIKTADLNKTQETVQ